MSRPLLCDLCGKEVMPEFKDLGYKITVKELKHSYDGYNPWVRKTKLDICESCIGLIILGVRPVNAPPQTSELPKEEAV